MASGKKPILPRHPSNPAGQTKRILRARRAANKQLNELRDWLLERFEAIPAEPEMQTNALYEYQIDITILEDLVRDIRRRAGEVIDPRPIINEARMAYEHGTGEAVTNLSKITDEYTRTITQVLSSQPWQRRVSLVGARIFEEMQGFQGDTARQLGRTLMDAVSDGVNPREAAKTIRERFDVAKTRAERIARTEITGAARRARWDEADDARQRLGINLRMLHLSALSPTTRESHAARHGNLYTTEQVREWYSRDANAINCKCSQVEVPVDENGEPLTRGAINV